ncbi:MAG: M15 family metallopeptidase, partial [Deltaproteobacteria bacterium]|nr:M15 family metallopeptidase [Kofleriaceae bacterium]
PSIPPPPPMIEAPTVQGPSIAANVPAAPPTPAPSPSAAPDVLAPVVPKIEAKPVEVAQEAPKADVAPAPAPVKGQATRLVVKGGSQSCLVFISPDGVTSKPDLFIFFHGYQADYGKDVDTKQKRPKKMALYKSGADVAEEAMAFATGKNLIAILPQGNIGRKDERGGHMKALAGGLAPFVTSVLANIAKELGVPALEPGNIGLAGHSAGGYEGIHQAMGSDEKMGDLADNITDVTLMDSAYNGVHFEDTRDWLFGGPPGKNLRIIGQAVQMAKNRDGGHRKHFAFDKLARYADKRGFTVKELPEGEKRDTSTVIQHTQIINPAGEVQGDVLVLLSSRKGGQGHHDIRDDVMDDAILSIGEGAAGNASFDQDRTSGQPAPAPTPQQPQPAQAQDEGLVQHGQEQPQQEGGGDDDGSGNPVPTPQHVDGADEGSKEPVQAPPIPNVQPPPAPKAEGRGDLKFPSGSKVADRLYGPEGVAAVEKLHRENTVKVKGKDVHIYLDDEQWAFKQRCYAACVARLGDQLYGGVSPGELTNVSSGKMRHKAASQLDTMIAAFRNDPNRPPDEDLKPGSAYRPPEEDFNLWDMGFNNIYLWKIIDWAKKNSPKDPWGDKVLKKAVQLIGERKAPPGGSNHSNGTAIDLKLKYKGTWRGNKYDDQAAWEASYAYKWLLKRCKDFQFKNYSKECWHYDYKGPH